MVYHVRKIKTIIEFINMLLTKAEIIHFHQIGDPLSLKEDWFIKRSEDPKVDLLDGRYILR